MSDPVPSSAIYDATVGGLSVIVVTGGSTGDVLTKQSDGTYAPVTPSSGGVSALGTTGTDLNISSSTLNVPDASATARGVVTTGTQTIAGAKTLSSDLTLSTGRVNGLMNYNIYIGNNVVDFRLTTSVYMSLNHAGWLSFDNRTLLGWVASGQANQNPDTALWRNAAGVVEINNGTKGTYRDLLLRNLTASGLLCAGTYTVSTLPSASANAYKFATVSDSSVTTFGSTVAGSGSSKVMVYSNGTNWTVFAA